MKYFVIKSPHQVGNSFLLKLFRLEETMKQSKQTFILKMTFIIVFNEISKHVQIICIFRRNQAKFTISLNMAYLWHRFLETMFFARKN